MVYGFVQKCILQKLRGLEDSITMHLKADIQFWTYKKFRCSQNIWQILTYFKNNSGGAQVCCSQELILMMKFEKFCFQTGNSRS